MLKDYKKRRKKFLDDFKENLPKYTNYLPSNIYLNEMIEYETDSWFDLNKYKSDEVSNNIKIKNTFPKTVKSCQKIKILFTDSQKLITVQPG